MLCVTSCQQRQHSRRARLWYLPYLLPTYLLIYLRYVPTYHLPSTINTNHKHKADFYLDSDTVPTWNGNCSPGISLRFASICFDLLRCSENAESPGISGSSEDMRLCWSGRHTTVRRHIIVDSIHKYHYVNT